MGVSKNYRYPFVGYQYNEDYNISGSTLESPYLRKLPYYLLGFHAMNEPEALQPGAQPHAKRSAPLKVQAPKYKAF